MTAVPSSASPSVFDVRPLGRMLWKEYRQQRTLWLGVLVFGVLLQVIARIAASVFQFNSDGRDAMIAVWAIPLYLVGFFLIGSTAMLFALEREERTSDWLLNLSAPPLPILVAKYGFALVAAISLSLVLWMSAAVLSVGLRFEYGWLVVSGASFETAFLEWLAVCVMVVAGILLWGGLGSLTSRRVIVAVPTGGAWWLLIVVVPLAAVHYWYWYRYGPSLGSLDIGLWGLERVSYGLLAISVVATVTMNIVLGLRWCRGQYFDATYFEELNESWSSWLMKLLRRRARTTRVPAALESEHSGWRTWQRLVWQERHRESLHTGLLVIVCALGVLLALYSLGSADSMTFAVIPFVVGLPCAMGVLGFRFDAGGQQLRFLANRGTSPTMIWLAKQVVWLPRAFWIPAVCWAVACFAEWAIVPWRGVDGAGLSTLYDQVRHPLVSQSFHERRFFMDAVWFALMSYAVGQAAAMLFRRMILAVGAGLMATIMLTTWQATAVVGYQLPRWWAVGGIAAWLLWLTWWYSRPWLIERRNSSVWKRLAAGLILPPLLLLFGVAAYRWLEVPGFGPSSHVLMAIMYPHECERRSNVVGDVGSYQVDEIRAAIARVSQANSQGQRVMPVRPAGAKDRFQLLSQIRLSPEFIASLPIDVSRKELERAAGERFWSVNAKPLETLLDFHAVDSPASYQAERLELSQEVFTKPQLLLDAGRLSLERGDVELALRSVFLGLWLGREIAAQGDHFHWCAGREQQAEVLQSLVAWSNHESVTRELLITAMTWVRAERSQFPTLQETSVAEFVQSEGFVQSVGSVRLQMEREESPMMRVAQQAAVMLLPHEFARRTRQQEQMLFWRWHFYRSIEGAMRVPGLNVQYSLPVFQRQLTRVTVSDYELWSTLSHGSQSRFGYDVVDQVTGFEAVNRETLLALAIVLWKKDHNGRLPDSLEDLAAYCLIDGRKDPERVLPSMVLNDPRTGGMFGYSTASRKLAEANNDTPVVILASEGTGAFGQPNKAVQNVSDKGVEFANSSLIVGTLKGVLIQSLNGRLSLILPPSPKR